MRDIRQELTERLQAAVAERDRHEAQLARLAGRIEMLQQLIGDEEAEWSERQLLLVDSPPTPPRTPLARFILDTLSDGRIWRRDDLTRAASESKFSFDGKSAWRTLHCGLVALKKQSLVESVASGAWRIAKRNDSGDAVLP